MSTEADFADAHRLPRTPPRATPAPPAEDPRTAVPRPAPPERPATTGPGPMPPAAPTAATPPRPAGPAAPPAAAAGPPPDHIPPRPAQAPAPPRAGAVPIPAPVLPPAGAAPVSDQVPACTDVPPRPAQAPVPPPAGAVPVSVPPQAPADRSAAPRDAAAAPRDTAAFHLANSEAFWNAPGGAEARPQVPAAPPRPAQPRAESAPPPTGHPLSGPPVPPAPTAPPYAAKTSRRTALAAAGLVLGLGLVVGATTGTWLADDPDGSPAAEAVFAHGREAWHSAPVDTLFPRTLNGLSTGPGGADRTWVRAAVAPDSGCAGAFDPLLAKALAPVGCGRLVRATYVDATHTNLVTVGAVSTKADRTAMKDLRRRFATELLDTRTDLMPRPYAAKGTPAAGFGPEQRASWTLRVLDDLPVVVYAVSGFADGRTVDAPQPAAEATRKGATTAPAEAGLGHDAKAVTERIEQTFRKQATRATTESP
ncbi:hypothetical protein [Streptomyces sp. NPDC018045]|uniref:hypothetical protein n=1 Tax=Streptomyces sp. NPDC018045 TaxID=3365037 RepID=UPI0037A88F7E